MENSFFFITPEVEFEETSRGARIVATFMELEKRSNNGRFYLIEEANQIIQSLVGKAVYYGTNIFGQHDNPVARGEESKAEPIGFVESAKRLGNKIK